MIAHLLHADVPREHPLSRWCMRLRVWSKPDIESGQFTARIVVVFGWMGWFLALCIWMGDHPVRLYATTMMCDLALRQWGVRSSVLWVPIWALSLGLAGICWVSP